ncbi:MAG: cytochrome c peroxidase [Pirellulaceae bacterium]|jgi:cytochrome c peroxidase|nr:cytochrome c peroxidase [Pirellulaceae bacterium]
MRKSSLVTLAGLLLLTSLGRADEIKLPQGIKRMRVPADNPFTQAKADLGKLLYFDKRLSVDDTVSCASCHDPKKGWSNGERFATGVEGQKGGRSAPTIINSGLQVFQFWDGRALQLEGQALGPIENPIEMAMPLDDLIEKLNGIKGYREQFQNVFKTDATKTGVAQAIASFERTVLSGGSPFDQYKAGKKSALNETQARGRKLFFGKANCSACHAGQNFTDGAFHNLGVGMDAEESKRDLGRFAVTKLEGDKGSFKTPTLREISRSAPYMHDGSLPTLEAVVDFYAKGGIKNPQLDEELFPLKLTDQDKKDLVEFLKALNSPDYPDVEPPKEFPQ